jgi:putative ABC transport system permease protein
MSHLPLSLRFLAREWRAGELRVLLLAVALAVASLSAVAFFGDRVEQALGREANTLLAADLALVSDHPIDPKFAAEARRRSLQTSGNAIFLSMALAGERNLLAGVKGVAPGYPLRGELRTAPAPFSADAPTRDLPAPGEAWLDPRAATTLGVAVGGEVELGTARFKVARILTFEGERGGNFLALAPRVMVRDTELAKTGLIQEGSRITYRLLVAGEREAVAAFQDWSQPRLQRGEKLESLRDARPELRQTLDKTRHYLGLAAVLTVILAAAASHLALRRYVQRQFDQYALMRCFGASQRRLFGHYFQQLAALGLLAGLVGAVLGWLTQLAIADLLGQVLRLPLPAASWQPFGLGLVAGLALVLAFALPPLLRLARVPSLRVLRRELGPTPGGAMFAHLAGLALIAALIWWQAGEAKLALIVGGGVLAVMLAAAGLIRALLWSLTSFAHRLPTGPRLGLLGLRQRGWETTLQAMSLSLGLLSLLLLTLVRGDLIDSWRDRVPPNAPNRFVINIQPEQVAGVADFLKRAGIRDATLYPMIRARLTAIAGRPLKIEDLPEGRARGLAERQFNLSELAELPPDNELVAGRWWRPKENDGFTVEEGVAKTLGIHLGDQLDFDVGGLPLSGRVASLRKVEWDSFRVNFFVASPPGALDALPKSYITSFHLEPARARVMADLIAAYPNLTLIDVAQVLDELRHLSDRVSLAVEAVFGFSLAVGVLVMLAALYSRRQERALEIGIWRALGASRRTLRQAIASELAVLGALAGLVAAAAASGLAWLLARKVFELPHQLDPWVGLIGIGGGAALVLLAGWLATRDLLDEPPLKALRGAG